MRTARIAVWVFLCLVELALAEDPVYFADPLLKEAVEQALWITNPTPRDMLDLTKLERVGDSGLEGGGEVSDLTGLEYATNLRSLNLRFNLIGDISPLSGLSNLERVDLSRNQIGDPSPLSGLNRLTSVNLHANNITDVSPLSNLTNVTTLILRFNEITDLSPLAGMTNLRELDLGDNPLGDLTPLSSLTGLTILCLWGNQISDLSVLSGLTRIETLDLDMNCIRDVSPLARLINLRCLDLDNNLVSDISALCNLTSLSFLNLENNPLSEEAYTIHIPRILLNNPGISILYDRYRLTLSSSRGGSVVVPGEGEYWYPKEACVQIEAQADPGYKFAGWSGTCPSAENPLLITLDRQQRMEAHFVRPLAVLYVDDDAFHGAGPETSDGSDPDEDGTAEHPFNSIQEAVEVAGEGVAIMVHPGNYFESIDLLAKNVRLIGTELDNPAPQPWPVIEGTDIGPVASF